MKLATLALAGALVMGAGISGNAIAHEPPGRAYGAPLHHETYRGHKPWRRHAYRPYYRKHPRWHRDHYRPHYRHRPYASDSWYGIHLFFGGH